ncbi:uncharacterized protein LOC101851232 isoform X2 [Aplysia californica]|uniref:Uncharacterized protein LOC101851232 isoform X2 n=1 Tax=Aplysia californica TaxID=6500 RepID=A0ABM1W2M0_APLCA|nr:uncharacterized protein LOC101851232 isoform X2 [Aplysia californica]
MHMFSVNYLIDEGVLVGKGSNTVISLLHHFFETHGLGESAVSLHCDKCSGQNKSGFVLTYLRRRVLRGLHKEIILNFMIAGHTKFSPDLCFGLLKRKFQRAEVHCLEGMCRVVEESSSVNVPQLAETEDGTVSVLTYNWQTFVADFRTVPGMKKIHYFCFAADHPGVVKHAESFGDPLVSMTLLRGTMKQGFLSILPAPGLSQQRREYLYNSIREFVTDDKKDITCPPP